MGEQPRGDAEPDAMPGAGDGVTVLVVDDDPMIRGLLTTILKEDAYVVNEAEDALAAMASLASDPPDLILLDVTMPAVNGIEFLDRIRKTNDVPVILISGKGHEDDRILGLKHGADDYIVKPFSHKEVLARVETVLRRMAKAPAPPSADAEPSAGSGTRDTSVLEFERLAIDKASHEVRVEGKLVEFTAKEFELLVFLASSPRQVFNREQLLQQVWASSSDWQDDATVTEHVRRLRRKIEADPDHPQHLVTVRGVGYRFEP